VVSDWRLKEEGEVGKNGSKILAVYLDPGEDLSEDDHVNHYRNSKERILTNVVGGDRVDTTHEDL